MEHPELRPPIAGSFAERLPIAIVGATATGKSRLGLHLAKKVGGEIVNADALQVYRGFDIGTAKPSAAEQALAPHHLLDILEPQERYSAGRFARLARRAIDDIEGRKRLPLVVGGSGLYLRALLEGLSPLPRVSEEVERGLVERLETDGLEGLRADLERLDPRTARRLEAGDTQRTLRALGVVLSSGTSLSDWIARKPFGEQRIEAFRIGLTLDRPVLYDRVTRRIERMMGAGWVQEVRSLLARGLDPSLPAFQAIGYRQLAAHLRGECSLEEAVAEIVRSTRQFARRQLTWFRKDPTIVWFEAERFEKLRQQVEESLGLA
ncbi:MAG: tRNA (adenosine(37)-N6)-dimethylallyltransferase MiaA [Acidobacteriota bacterium]|nr:tRNA (adenosine(37)-N6)-dimethylallyltransferase MiaA [Acidobacteriota bacterium]